MRSLAEAKNQFAYHPAIPATAERHAALRDLTSAFAEQTWDLIPDGPEKTLALRALQQFQMYGNLAIALLAPTDTTHHAVARVLPEGTK